MSSRTSFRPTVASATTSSWDDSTSTAAEASPARRALSESPVVELRELQVHERDDGMVISGRVQSFYHKQLAQETVRPHAGARRLVNHVRVEA
jgi:hypothetical protein